MYPMKMNPPFKDYIWGGTRLKTEWGKKSDLEIVAESWELSCHPSDPCIIANGKYAGKTLPEVIELLGKNCLGSDCAEFDRFPILIKLIDAKNDLSIQVHPNDEYALKNENEYGKTEMWYIVDADEDASLIYGFARDITKDEFKQAIEENKLMDVLNKVPVHKGDVFFIPAGMVHAIGKGILIAEIQQNSNITYRVYDYGRLGADGKPRELHIEKAVDVSNLTRPEAVGAIGAAKEDNGVIKTMLASCKYFTTEKLEIKDSCSLKACEKSFVSLLFLDGNGTVNCNGEKVVFNKGDSFFIPAGTGDINIEGASTLLLTRV